MQSWREVGQVGAVVPAVSCIVLCRVVEASQALFCFLCSLELWGCRWSCILGCLFFLSTQKLSSCLGQVA